MGNFTVNMIFVAIFAGFAWNSLPKGWRFFKVGWIAVRSNVEKDDDTSAYHIEKQRDLQQGSSFLIAGTAWLLGGIASVIATITFAIFAFLNLGIFNLIS